MTHRIFGDFETRSLAELKRVGTYKYARHESTEVLCFAWALDDGPVQLWHPGFVDLSYCQATKKADRVRYDLEPIEDPLELFEAILAGAEFEAHNAFFERNVWDAIMVPKFGWPAVDFDQWRCSAALAASLSMRRRLEHLAADLGVKHQKDMEGHAVMKKMTRPRKPTKQDPHSPFHQRRADLERVFAYCVQDVEAERDCGRMLRAMPADEICTWQMDQEINLTGLHMDRPMIHGALRIGAEAEVAANRELNALTNGAVEKATKRPAFKQWLKDEGVKVPTVLKRIIDDETGEETWEERETTGKEHLRPLLKSGNFEPHVHRAIEVFLDINKSSVKKYQKMLDMMDGDGVIRETLRYHAASTGRWGGMGIQPQNLPRKAPKAKQMEQLCQDIAYCSYEEMCLLHGEDKIMDLLSSALRGTILAPEGEELLVADLSAVEARGTFWISGHKKGLQVFHDIDAGKMPGEDIYTWQASQILKRKVTKKDEDLRQTWGKVPVLGCGYQMGAAKLVTYAAAMGIIITFEQAEKIVRAYRQENKPVVNSWYEIERAAVEAVRRGPDRPAVVCLGGRIRWKVIGDFLHCRLPSGRLLSYYKPRLAIDEKFGTPKVEFMGYATYKPGLWTTCSTYGGKLIENVVQALCRDLMRDAMLRVRKHFAGAGLKVILTVHDEIVARAVKGRVEFEEFLHVLSIVSDWAEGFPLAWEGWARPRYGK